MLDSLIFGAVAASSLVVGALLAMRFKIPPKILGLIMAFGVGALISSVAFELTEDAFGYANDIVIVIAGILAGAITYFICDWLVDKSGGKNRKNTEKSDRQSGMAILVGTILDGIPESMVIGLGLAQGGAVSITMIVAVFISNIPESLSSSVGLLRSGWRKWSIFGLWTLVVVISAIASVAGFVIFGDSDPKVRAFIMAFAGGAILTMLSDSMLPTAYKDSGRWTGIATVLGFSIAFAISVLE